MSGEDRKLENNEHSLTGLKESRNQEFDEQNIEEKKTSKINCLTLEGKIKLLESMDIDSYREMFKNKNITKIKEITFSGDGNNTFICTQYIGDAK